MSAMQTLDNLLVDMASFAESLRYIHNAYKKENGSFVDEWSNGRATAFLDCANWLQKKISDSLKSSLKISGLDINAEAKASGHPGWSTPTDIVVE